MRSTTSSPLRTFATVAAATLCLALLGACGSEDGDDTATDPAPAASSDATSESASAEATADATCEYPEDGMPPAKEVDAPSGTPTATGPVSVTLETSAGTINAELDGAATPCTVNSFLSLAEQMYYNDTDCHRLTTQGIFVLQCGDPTASGTGGPGYSFADELSGAETYPAGTLAMANAGPNTNGSQFFIVYDDTAAAAVVHRLRPARRGEHRGRPGDRGQGHRRRRPRRGAEGHGDHRVGHRRLTGVSPRRRRR